MVDLDASRLGHRGSTGQWSSLVQARQVADYQAIRFVSNPRIVGLIDLRLVPPVTDTIESLQQNILASALQLRRQCFSLGRQSIFLGSVPV